LAAGPGELEPAFYALPAGDAPDRIKSQAIFAESGTAPLYEVRDRGGEYRYSVNPQSPGPEWERSKAPLCRVWKNPCVLLSIDAGARPDVAPQ
jgi:hypothetical protein